MNRSSSTRSETTCCCCCCCGECRALGDESTAALKEKIDARGHFHGRLRHGLCHGSQLKHLAARSKVERGRFLEGWKTEFRFRKVGFFARRPGCEMFVLILHKWACCAVLAKTNVGLHAFLSSWCIPHLGVSCSGEPGGFDQMAF